MPRGKIKTYLEDRRFGFITPDQGGGDLFFHFDDVNDRGYAIEAGAPVDFEIKPGRKPGELKAVRVRVLDFAPDESSGPTKATRPSRSPSTAQQPDLPPECLFDSFYGDDGRLEPRVFYEAAQKAAEVFRRSGLKSTQFRQVYQGFMSFAGPLRDNRLEFAEAKERFGAFYVERIVRQTERKVLPRVIKALIDAHRELALSDRRETLALFRYLKNIYCYFGESDKN